MLFVYSRGDRLQPDQLVSVKKEIEDALVKGGILDPSVLILHEGGCLELMDFTPEQVAAIEASNKKAEEKAAKKKSEDEAAAANAKAAAEAPK
jgi:hypothetical protein